LAQVLANREATLFRQHEIEDNQIKMFAGRKVQAGRAVAGGTNGVTFFAKPVLKGFEEARFVFDDQDFGVHGEPLSNLLAAFLRGG